MAEEIRTKLKRDTKVLFCYLDGDSLCIVDKNFINLQESEAMFIELTPEQITEFNNLAKKEKT